MRESEPIATMQSVGEEAFLARVGELLAAQTEGLELGTGDDVAITRSPAAGTRLVWTVDAMVEGTHFRVRRAGELRGVGRKLAAVNLSDLAAKGAQPRYALLSLGVPPSASVASLEMFIEGLCTKLGEHGARLIGGDTVRAPQWTLSLAAAGELPAHLPIAARTKAAAGMWVYVTGTLGDSAAGFDILEGVVSCESGGYLVDRHLDPTPRVGEGRALIEVAAPIAMMDLSDGLARDANRMAAASKAALLIEEETLPISPELKQMCAECQRSAMDYAITGGEDYELFFATSATREELIDALRRHRIQTPITRIGRVIEGAGVWRETIEGERINIAPGGFEHFQ